MDLFRLPLTTKVNRVIPKNAFDTYTTAKQKKQFTDLIARITWTHKLSKDTVNLEGKDIKEIQVFRIELKVKEEIQTVLDIIDKSIPYSIVFVIEFDTWIYISTSTKHSHPTNVDNAVIDWTFKTGWFQKNGRVPELQLKGSLDYSYFLFCLRIAGYSNEWSTKTMTELVNHIRMVSSTENEIARLKSLVSKSSQFNQKVEYNMKLKAAEEYLALLLANR